MKYEIGRNNLAITVFVPWDCQNNCQFCTSKKEYQKKDCNNTSEDKKITNIIRNYLTLGIKEVVFTGGEPLAQPMRLLKIIANLFNAVDLSYDVKDIKLYINTSLPKIQYSEKDNDALKVLLFDTKKPLIAGLNISRHFESFEKDCAFYSGNILPDSFIDKIKVPVRINTVYNVLDLDAYFKRWASLKNVKLELSLRADYRFIDNSNLKSFADEGFIALAENEHLEYISSGGCLVCNNDNFMYVSKQNFLVTYHRGLESSACTLGNTVYINDIIITATGALQFDWQPSAIDEDIEEINKCIAIFNKGPRKINIKKDNTPIPSITRSSMSCGRSSGGC